MNYFIDFEATQFSNEIISIGCVNETGEKFSSMVYTDKKITSFITNLTGITDGMNKAAPSLDDVFTHFFYWVLEHNDGTPCRFFCYGSTDLAFVHKAIKKATGITAQMSLSLIAANLINYAPTVKNHFGLIKEIALIKVVNYYKKEELVQTHSALEDAEFLKIVFDEVNQEGTVKGHPFPDYEPKIEINKSALVAKGTKPAVTRLGLDPKARKAIINNTECIYAYDADTKALKHSFNTFAEACDWLCNHIRKTMPKYKRDNQALAKKIIWSDMNKLTYQNLNWTVVQKGDIK